MARYRPSWLSFPRFAAFTTGMTLVLVMLGVYTAATGSGLACSAQWPLCDNGLLPQSVPSFIEWFHRLWAMITGFLILGTAGWAWRGAGDRGTKLAAALAVVVLPVQISIGAITVTLSGMFPQGYSPPTQTAHLLAALTIFTALVATTLLAFEGRYRRPAMARARLALRLSLGFVLVSAVLSRAVGLVSYRPAVQAVFVGVTLALFAVVFAATHWLGRAGAGTLRLGAGGALVLAFTVLVLGRDLLVYTADVQVANALVYLALALVLAGVTLLAHRDPGTGRRRHVPSD